MPGAGLTLYSLATPPNNLRKIASPVFERMAPVPAANQPSAQPNLKSVETTFWYRTTDEVIEGDFSVASGGGYDRPGQEGSSHPRVPISSTPLWDTIPTPDIDTVEDQHRDLRQDEIYMSPPTWQGSHRTPRHDNVCATQPSTAEMHRDLTDDEVYSVPSLALASEFRFAPTRL